MLYYGEDTGGIAERFTMLVVAKARVNKVITGVNHDNAGYHKCTSLYQ